MFSVKFKALGLIAGAAVALAACSSSGGTTGGDQSTNSTGAGSQAVSSAGGNDAAGGGAGLTAAKANAAKFAAIPTKINQTVPLKSAPPKGKKIGFVVCADPSCTILSNYLKQATTALGWQLVTVNASATDPGAAIQQLIDAGVDYVSETGMNVDQFQPQYNELKAKKIPLFECYATDVPHGPANDIYSDCFDASAAKVYGAAMADWIIADSNGKANTLLMNLPAFPILTAQADAVKKEFAKNCPDCQTAQLDLTVNDLSSTGVSSQLTSYLQTHPDVTYVYEMYEGFDALGVASSVKAAAGGNVKIVGEQAFQPEMQEVINGTETAWSELPENLSMWSMADQMARLASNAWTSKNERATAVPPLYIISSAQEAQKTVNLPNGWEGPQGFRSAYEKLWGL